MSKTCCCTGHRPKGFPFKYGVNSENLAAYLAALREKIENAITEHGVTNFISGMALGVDMDFAEAVLFFKEKYSVALECAVPCPEQTLKWQPHDLARYEKIISRADKVTVVSDRYTPECMLTRNRYMVDKSELVIAVFNGIRKGGTWYTISYANSCGKKIEMIDLTIL